MHRKDVTKREEIIEQREDRFLCLSGVTRAADEDQFPAEVHQDEGLRIRPVFFRIGQTMRRIYHSEFRNVTSGLFIPIRAAKHVTGEEAMPGILVDDSDRNPVIRIGTRKTVLNIDVFYLDIVQDLFKYSIEAVLARLAVGLTPPDMFFR